MTKPLNPHLEGGFPLDHWRDIPVIGLDRNQPLRRYLSRTGRCLPVQHLDPGVVYYWPGRRVVRGSSVEAWIETCAEVFPGEGIRDFWELIWNLSVYTWDFLDKLGKEPWRKPNPGFPFLNPSFWRGARRTRLLFVESMSFIRQFSIQDNSAFVDWAGGIVRFQYGAGLESIPLGMVALALNAPSESYLLESEIENNASEWEGSRGIEPSTFRGAWRIPFTPGKGWEDQGCPVHQIFLEPPVENLTAQTVVLVVPSSHGGHLYLRVRPDLSAFTEAMIRTLEGALASCLGQEWGTVAWPRAERVAAYLFLPGLPVEMEWPWLGCVRALLLQNKGDTRFSD